MCPQQRLLDGFRPLTCEPNPRRVGPNRAAYRPVRVEWLVHDVPGVNLSLIVTDYICNVRCQNCTKTGTCPWSERRGDPVRELFMPDKSGAAHLDRIRLRKRYQGVRT